MNILRKLVVIIPILCMFSPRSYAQSWKNETYFEYSQATVPQGAYLIGGVFGVMFSLGHFSFENTVMTGTFAVGYNRNVNNWFGYGGQAFMEYITSDSFTTNSDGEKVRNGKYDMCLFSLMPTVKFTWFENPKFGMYSKLGAGVGLSIGSETQVFPSFQVSPVCMDFGGGNFKGIVEIGAGMQGCLTVGVKHVF